MKGILKHLVVASMVTCAPALSTAGIAKMNVFACTPEWKALADQIGGDDIKSYSATTAFQDAHFIEARPSLIAKTRKADLVVCTGADLEVGWLPVLLRKSGNAGVQPQTDGLLLAAEVVDRIEVPTELDRSHGDIHAAGNPHVHWDPYRVLTIAKTISERLSAIDRQNANDYAERYSAFESSWKKRIAEWEALASSLRGKKVIVHHKSWSYLVDWLGIEVVGDLEPKPGLPPTSRHLASLLERTQNSGVDYILVANYQDPKASEWLSKRSNIPVLRLPFTVGGSSDSKDLASLYESVLGALVNAGQ